MAADGTSFFRRYRFLVSRRWILLILAVAMATTLCGFLAQWQLGKNADRSGENARIQRAMQAEPRPLDEVLTVGKPVPVAVEWQPVRAHGRYQDDQVLVRYRDHHGQQGFHVLTPLRTRDGSVLLINRGWIPGRPTDPPEPPSYPSGEVTVTGRARVSESGEVDPDSGQVRFIDVPAIASWLDAPTYGGYLELTGQRPQGNDAPALLEAPELDPGPFLSYGIQWYIFGGIAVAGLGILTYDEAHGGKLQRRWKIKG